MNRCRKRGLARHLGVSSFTVPHLQAILDICNSEIDTSPPALNQIELHPLLPQPDLLAFMQLHNIALEGFASLTPLTFHPSSLQEQEVKDRVIACAASLASRHGAKEVSSVLLRYAIDLGASVVTTSSKRTRLETHLTETQTFTLSAKDVAALELAAGPVRVRGFFAKEMDEPRRPELL
jgi:alcohol dehydrogenase (NADP+)